MYHVTRANFKSSDLQLHKIEFNFFFAQRAKTVDQHTKTFYLKSIRCRNHFFFLQNVNSMITGWLHTHNINEWTFQIKILWVQKIKVGTLKIGTRLKTDGKWTWKTKKREVLTGDRTQRPPCRRLHDLKWELKNRVYF